MYILCRVNLCEIKVTLYIAHDVKEHVLVIPERDCQRHCLHLYSTQVMSPVLPPWQWSEVTPNTSFSYPPVINHQQTCRHEPVFI